MLTITINDVHIATDVYSVQVYSKTKQAVRPDHIGTLA
jgi:hypothetical protein